MRALQEAIREASDPTLLMQRVTEQALALLPMADGASLEIRTDDDTLEYVAAVGTLKEFNGLRLNVHKSISGLALVSGEIVRTDDARDDPRADAEAVRRTGAVSMLALPLRSGTDQVAVLKVISHTPNAFGPGDDQALEALADFLRTALSLASELARVTTTLLAAGAAQDLDEPALQSARFVAEVMRPGLVEDIIGHQRIRDILSTTKMEMVLQPISDLGTGDIRFVEALTRFITSPPRSPDVWFAEAHRVGLGLQLELAAVHNAVSLLSHIPESVALCINIGPVALRSSGLLDLIPEQHRRRVVLEITEHEALDPVALAGPVSQLRESGVRIAIDDTGSGYASLSTLLRIKPDIIKLDRDLVRGVDHDPVRRALGRALVHFAQEDSHATVIAEGIETEAEAATLVALGVPLGQGYFLGRPCPVSHMNWGHTWHMIRPLTLLPDQR